MGLPTLVRDTLDSWNRHRRYGERPLPAKLIHIVRKRLWSRNEKRVYVFPVASIASLADPALLRRDHVEDLDYYERIVTAQGPREAYRNEAHRRLARGEHLYTLVENGRLIHYAWLDPSHERGIDPSIRQVFFPPPHSAALYDHFTHPQGRRRGLFHDAMCQLLHEVRRMGRSRQAYIYVFAENDRSRRVIEKVGFRYVGSMVQENRFTRVRRYAVSAGDAFKTGLL